MEGYRQRLNRPLATFGDLPIQRITDVDVANMVESWRHEKLSAWTVRAHFVPLARVFKFALKRRYIAVNPLDRFDRSELPPIEDSEKRVLSPEELKRLIAGATPTTRPLIATLALTGMRVSEVCGLVWDDVDFKEEEIRVRLQLQRGAGGRRVKLKSPSARREVILVAELAALLKAHKEQALSRGHASPESFVFSTATGRPWSQRNANEALYAAAKRAGFEGIHCHSLRHSFVSILILELGFDAVRVAEQVGHKKPSLTYDVYTTLFKKQAGHADEMRKKIAASSLGSILAV